MVRSYKTPGVYINEMDAFPSSVVPVETAVPAFIGYTEFAAQGDRSLTLVPTRVSSLAEFEKLFGGPSHSLYDASKDGSDVALKALQNHRFLLYSCLRLFFNQGGTTCWIVSLGGYGTAASPTLKTKEGFLAGLEALNAEAEPTLIVAPDAVLLSRNDWADVSNASLTQCAGLRNRMAILDVYDGDQPRNFDTTSDVISGTQGFRGLIHRDHLSDGVVYYPWLNTTLTEPSGLDFSHITFQTRQVLHDAIIAEITTPERGIDAAKAKDLLAPLLNEDAQPEAIAQTHKALMSVSPLYKDLCARMSGQENILPPSAAMAGVYAQIDAEIGVWKAPANVGLNAVNSPTVKISSEDQGDLNTPFDGKAVNAIRTFPGQGIKVWGARTLDGNSLDWRYINVRRTAKMIEASAALALETYVFSPNDGSTWLSIASTIDSFLNGLWKEGALVGATPQEAYSVAIGLGSTMTAQDVLNGKLIVSIKVCLTHPAEYTVLTLQQEMQRS